MKEAEDINDGGFGFQVHGDCGDCRTTKPEIDVYPKMVADYLHVSDDGSDAWRTTPDKDHAYLVRKMDPKKIAAVIKKLMLRQPRRLSQT